MVRFNEKLIPNQARVISKVLKAAGYDAYLVGGCVRDGIIGAEPNDYDFCTNANARQIVDVLKANEIEYKDEYSFLDYIIANVDGMEIDICKFHGETIEEDLRARDITINAIAYDIEEDRFVDTCGGLADIENGIIRLLSESALAGSPQQILRAMRFSLQYGFKIEDESYGWMKNNVEALRNVRTSQVEKNVRKMLKNCKPAFMGKE